MARTGQHPMNTQQSRRLGQSPQEKSKLVAFFSHDLWKGQLEGKNYWLNLL
jgi:hypothetical protein